MFLAKWDNNEGKEEFYIYYTNKNGYKQFVKECFSSDSENVEVLILKLEGNTYEEKKAFLEDLAKEYQYRFSSLAWSYNELYEICNFFEKNGKRYGLLKEFKENAIC